MSRCWDSFCPMVAVSSPRSESWLNPLIVASAASTRHLAKAELLGKHWAKAFAVDWQNGPPTCALCFGPRRPRLRPVVRHRFGVEIWKWKHQFIPIPFSDIFRVFPEFSQSFPRIPEICSVWEVRKFEVLMPYKVHQGRGSKGLGTGLGHEWSGWLVQW